MKQIILILILLIGTNMYARKNDGWNISTSSPENYTGIVLANGRIGIMPTEKPFETKHIVLNNVYDKESADGVSNVLLGMNFGNLDMDVDGERITEDNIENWSQTLNMKEAGLTTSFSFQNKVEISYTTYALRNIPYAGYFDISIKANTEVDIKVAGKIVTPDYYQNPSSNFHVLHDYDSGKEMPVVQTLAVSNMGRHRVGASATFIFHEEKFIQGNEKIKLQHEKSTDYENKLIFEKTLRKAESFSFAWTGSVCSTADFSDPLPESERFVIFNLLTPKEDLLDKHKQLWAELWQGDIEIEGDLASQQDVRLGLYHLYSFARDDSDLSISPMGLSSQGYKGHIFWDTEIWMYPPLLALNHRIARSLLNYRSNRLEQAKNKAVNFGYKGAMFPWESDDTGEEATPTWALTGPFEHHITADIAIAFWNYYRVTKDLAWLKEQGFPLMKACAEFWVSRSTKNTDGTYSIKNVVGANEFAANIDDNAFTNGAAITALHFTTLAAKALGVSPNPDWETLADKIVIHKFPDGTTKENASYDGEEIKQADVNLLAYPLNRVNDKETLLKDLAYYEPKLAHDGPAMGKSIFAVIYARMGDAESAYRLFKASYEPNKRPPFGALSESATSNNPYFATGAGGMLQAVLFGFGGLHFTNEGIVQKNPILPDGWKSLTIRGVGKEKKTFVVE